MSAAVDNSQRESLTVSFRLPFSLNLWKSELYGGLFHNDYETAVMTVRAYQPRQRFEIDTTSNKDRISWVSDGTDTRLGSKSVSPVSTEKRSSRIVWNVHGVGLGRVFSAAD
jgi:hypothetical protein